MNVFLREMKSHRKGLIFWCLGMFALIAAGMAKYAAYEKAGDSVEQMMAQMPQAVQAVLGFAGLDLGTAAGFYGVLFLYIAVMGAVHAALLGAHLISKEERDRTSEFLYAKPVTRSHVLTGKLAAGLVNVVILNLVTLVSTVYSVNLVNDGEPINEEIALLMAGFLFIQLIFFTIGTAMAGLVKRPKAAPTLATSIMFLTFMFSVFASLNENLGFLKYLTPFKYFDAATLLSEGRLDPVYVALSVLITGAAVAGTYYFYNGRDLRV